MAESQPNLGATQADGESSASRYVESAELIAKTLKDCRDHRASLTLRFEGRSESYTCKLLDVAPRHFFIEDVTPRSGLELLRGGGKFSISARGDGVFAFIEEAKVVKIDSERGLPFFHIPLPKRLLVQHRRKASRIELPLRVQTSGASVTLHRKAHLNGALVDISVGGCRVMFEQEPEHALTPGETVKSCSINIPNLLDVHSEAAVRNIETNDLNGHVICGLELTEMHVTDRRRLERFVQSLAQSLKRN